MSKFITKPPVLTPDKRIVSPGMWRHQAEFHTSEALITLLLGGYGAGKTEANAKFSVAMTMHNAPSPFMSVSPSYKMAKRTIIPAIKNVLDRNGIRYVFNKSEHVFYIHGPNGLGVLWVGSGDDPDALKGSNLCGFSLDEPGIMDYEVFDQMMNRMRDPQARLLRAGLTGTPEQLNWLYEVALGDLRTSYPDFKLVQGSMLDNLALPQSFIDQRLSAYDGKLRQAYIEGEFVNLATGRIYYKFDRDIHVKHLNTEDWELIAGMDFNVNPMAFCVIALKNDHAHVLKCYEQTDSDTAKACRIIATDFPQIREVYPDASGGSRHSSQRSGTDHDIINSTDPADDWDLFTINRKKNPDLRDRWNTVNKRLEMGRLTIEPGSLEDKNENLIKGLEQLTHENLKKLDRLVHGTDAMGYPVEYKFNRISDNLLERKWQRN
jgi:PBSX family phage terminase large subunit